MQKNSFFRKLTARPSIFIVLAGLLVMAVAAPAAGAHHKEGHVGNPKQATAESLSIDLGDIDVANGDLEGVFNINSFDVDDGQLYAIGDLVGEFTPDEGEAEQFDESNVAVPVTTGGGNDLGIMQQDGDGVCPILFLELGPVFLDVLGLVVEIPDPIVLDIYAERGPGNLLGNLLCAIVGILDPAVEDPVQTPLDRLIDNVNRLLERILG